MDTTKLTQKTQEAIQLAQNLAVRLGHQEVDGEHLLYGLLTQSDGLVPRLLTKIDVSAADLAEEARVELLDLQGDANRAAERRASVAEIAAGEPE